MEKPSVDLSRDFLDPRALRWQEFPDHELLLAAEEGIPQAVDEARRRGLSHA